MTVKRETQSKRLHRHVDALVRPQYQGFTPSDAFIGLSPRYGLGLRPYVSEGSPGLLAELLEAHELESLIQAFPAPALACHGPIQVVSARCFRHPMARSIRECTRTHSDGVEEARVCPQGRPWSEQSRC